MYNIEQRVRKLEQKVNALRQAELKRNYVPPSQLLRQAKDPSKPWWAIPIESSVELNPEFLLEHPELIPQQPGSTEAAADKCDRWWEKGD